MYFLFLFLRKKYQIIYDIIYIYITFLEIYINLCLLFYCYLEILFYILFKFTYKYIKKFFKNIIDKFSNT